MFENTNAFSSFSVDDLAKARKFYTEVLEQGVDEKDGYLEMKVSGGGRVMIYPKKDHKPATFTVFNLPVPSVEKAVTELNERGVRFEHYDREDIKTDERGIHRGMGPKIAWFKDPAGNILSIMEPM